MIARPLLCQAVIDGDLNEVRRLISEGNSANVSDDTTGLTPLHYAVKLNNLDIVNFLCSREDVELNTLDGYGVSPLYYAEIKSWGFKNSKIKSVLKEKNAKSIGFLTHGRLIEAMKSLNYGSIFDDFGICYLASSTTIDFFARGEDGIRDLNNRLLTIRKHDLNVLKNKITNSYTLRKLLTEKNKPIIASAIDDEFHTRTIIDKVTKKQYTSFDPTLINQAMQNEDSNFKRHISRIIKSIIKSEFNNATEKQKAYITNECIKYFLNNFNDAFVLDNLILEKITNAQKEWLVQHRLNKEIEKDFLDPDRFNGDIKTQFDGLGIKKYSDYVDYLNVGEFLEALEMNSARHYDLVPQNLQPLLTGLGTSWVRIFSEQNILATLPIIQSIETEEKGYAKRINFSNVYTHEELVTFLNLLKDEFQKNNIKNPIPFLIHSQTHTISMVYLPNKNAWGFFDINYIDVDLSKKYHPNTIDFLFTTKETDKLAKKIIDVADCPTDAIGFELFSSAKDEPAFSQSMYNLDDNPDWKNIHTITPQKSRSNLVSVSATLNNPNRVETAIEHGNFFQRHWKKILIFTGLACTAGIPVIVFTSGLSVPITIATSMGVAGSYFLISTAISWLQDRLYVNRSDQHQKFEQALEQNRNDERIVDSYNADIAFKPISLTREDNKLFDERLLAFFHKNKLESMPPFAKKIHNELSSPTAEPNITLSRSVSYAFEAKKYHHGFFKDKKLEVCDLYNEIMHFVSIEDTIKKIRSEIQKLDGKVYSGDEVEIKIDEKLLKVSAQVAKIFYLIIKAQDAINDEQAMQYLEKILEIARRESSIFTTKSSAIILRDSAVWNFFEKMNEFLIIKSDAIHKFESPRFSFKYFDQRPSPKYPQNHEQESETHPSHQAQCTQYFRLI